MHYGQVLSIVWTRGLHVGDAKLQDNEPGGFTDADARPRKIQRKLVAHGEIIVEKVIIVKKAHNLQHSQQQECKQT